MSLHATLLGGGQEGVQVGRMLEGLLMAQVALALARFGVADLLAGVADRAELAAGSFLDQVEFQHPPR
jgi:hypothetical protein